MCVCVVCMYVCGCVCTHGHYCIIRKSHDMTFNNHLYKLMNLSSKKPGTT